MPRSLYHLTVEGHLEPAASDALAPLDAVEQSDRTILSGRMEQSTLLDYLRTVTALSLPILAVERVDEPTGAQPR